MCSAVSSPFAMNGHIGATTPPPPPPRQPPPPPPLPLFQSVSSQSPHDPHASRAFTESLKGYTVAAPCAEISQNRRGLCRVLPIAPPISSGFGAISENPPPLTPPTQSICTTAINPLASTASRSCSSVPRLRSGVPRLRSHRNRTSTPTSQKAGGAGRSSRRPLR
jgi:hypothetical protein